MRVALWLVRRHSVFVLWYSHGGTPIWNHAGICRFRLLESFLGAKVRLNFFAVWSSVVSGRGVCFPFHQGRPDGRRVVRKVCMSFCFVIPSMFMQFIIVSIAKVQVGRLRDLSVYDFSHVSSIAWFLALRSRRLIPPFVLGFVRLLRLIPGGVLFPFQRKSRVIDWRVLVTVCGIPCALVWNCVMPPITICTISLFTSRVGLARAHLFMVSLILSIMGDQGWASSILLPIQAPRTWVAFPSVAILMPRGRGGSSGWICRVWDILPWCVSVPIAMISVFSRLNFAPDARHHFFRIFSRSEYLSVEDR